MSTALDELGAGATVGARFLCPGDAEWPVSLDILDITLEPAPGQGPSPLGLWIRGAGNLAAVTTRSVAVVGSRAATEYGLRVAAELAADLATAGWTIVSGAAYGIDAAAHRGTLRLAAPRWACLPAESTPHTRAGMQAFCIG